MTSCEPDFVFFNITTCDPNEAGVQVDSFINVGGCDSVVTTTTILDTTAPVPPPAPPNAQYNCASDVPAPDSLTAIDNCDGPITVGPTVTITHGSCPNEYTEMRTWTFTDMANNSSSISQTITVMDTVAPVVIDPVPPNLQISCTSDIPPPVNLTAVDNCDGPITVAPIASIIPGNCPNDFTLVRTWTFDDTCGNTSSVSQTITVMDTVAPVPPTPPPDMEVACASNIPPPVNLTAIDNCDGQITVAPTASIIPGNCPNDFTLVRTWTFDDTCGNTSSVSQTITVLDTVAPVPPTPPPDMEVACASNIPPPVNLTAIDNCDGPITVAPTIVLTPGNCPNNYTELRTWTFGDTCGNTSSVSQTITVLDTVAPILIDPVPQDISVCFPNVPSPVSLRAFDCEDTIGPIAPTVSTVPGECPNVELEIRTWTFTDSCGNTTSVSQTVTIQDSTAPIINCPDDIAVFEEGDGKVIVEYEEVTAIGGCSDPIEPVLISGQASGTPFCTGTTENCWQATDNCGNSSECCFKVSVLANCLGFLTDPGYNYNLCRPTETICEVHKLVSHYHLIRSLICNPVIHDELDCAITFLKDLIGNLQFDELSSAFKPSPGVVGAYEAFIHFVIESKYLVALDLEGNPVNKTNKTDAKDFGVREFVDCLCKFINKYLKRILLCKPPQTQSNLIGMITHQ